MSRFSYRRVGTMHYAVSRDGAELGELWRDRLGWQSRRASDGRREEHGDVSRDVAASALLPD